LWGDINTSLKNVGVCHGNIENVYSNICWECIPKECFELLFSNLRPSVWWNLLIDQVMQPNIIAVPMSPLPSEFGKAMTMSMPSNGDKKRAPIG